MIELQIGIYVSVSGLKENYERLAVFSKGLSLLDDYDHEQLDTKGLTTKDAVYPSREGYQELINRMLEEFDTAVFGLNRIILNHD